MTRCVNYAQCGNVIERDAEGWWEIIGWSKGGKGTVFDRTLTGTVMCEQCHTRRKYSGSTGQGDLFGP